MSKVYFKIRCLCKLLAILFLVSVLLCTPCSALADYIGLRILESSSFQASIQGEDLHLDIALNIVNEGNAQAVDVTPVFFLGKWSRSFGPRAVEPESVISNVSNVGAEESKHNPVSWRVHEVIPLSLISGNTRDPALLKSSPESINLSLYGRLPLRVMLEYRDAGNHGFSAPYVIELRVKGSENNSSGEAFIRRPEMQVSNSGNGQEFYAKVSLLNSYSKQFKASLMLFGSNELKFIRYPISVVIPPYGKFEKMISVSNFSGLNGSVYQLYAILEWSNAGKSALAIQTTAFRISEPDHSWQNWGLPFVVVLIFLFSILILYMFVFRKGRGAKNYADNQKGEKKRTDG